MGVHSVSHSSGGGSAWESHDSDDHENVKHQKHSDSVDVVDVTKAVDSANKANHGKSTTNKVDVGDLVDQASTDPDAVVVDVTAASKIQSGQVVKGQSPSKIVIDLGDSTGASSSNSSLVVVDTPRTPGAKTGGTLVIDASSSNTTHFPGLVVVDMTHGSKVGSHSSKHVHATVIDPGLPDGATSAAVSAAFTALMADGSCTAEEAIASIMEAIDNGALTIGGRNGKTPLVLVLSDDDAPPPTVDVAQGTGQISDADRTALRTAVALDTDLITITCVTGMLFYALSVSLSKANDRRHDEKVDADRKDRESKVHVVMRPRSVWVLDEMAVLDKQRLELQAASAVPNGLDPELLPLDSTKPTYKLVEKLEPVRVKG